MSKKTSILLISALYLFAGINHFINPQLYTAIVPSMFGDAEQITLWSGLAEVILSVLFLFNRTRWLAAWATIIFLIAVFPANIQMCFNHYESGNSMLWLGLLRLPVQFLLIRWAYLLRNKSIQLIE